MSSSPNVNSTDEYIANELKANDINSSLKPQVDTTDSNPNLLIANNSEKSLPQEIDGYSSSNDAEIPQAAFLERMPLVIEMVTDVLRNAQKSLDWEHDIHSNQDVNLFLAGKQNVDSSFSTELNEMDKNECKEFVGNVGTEVRTEY